MLINDNYNKLCNDYLFTRVRKNTAKFIKENPEVNVIDLGIGDVRLPPPKTVMDALRDAACQLGTESGFKGYSEEAGYIFLRQAISQEYREWGAEVAPDEIFITDGAKPAIGNLLELLSAKTALIITPCYPLYKDLCAVFGISAVYAEGNAENAFIPSPDYGVSPDVIFLCSPGNPTGTVISEKKLREYIDYAVYCGALIIFDGAYNAFLFGGDNKTIFTLKGAESCAVEVMSYSKSISFTGVRCGYTVIKKQLPLYEYYKKRESIRTNGVCYIAQRGAAASYLPSAKQQTRERIEYYRENARLISQPIKAAGLKCFGGENSPYLFFECGNGGESGERFCERLLHNAHIAATPGEGFCAPGYARLSCFCSASDAIEAGKRLREFFRK